MGNVSESKSDNAEGHSSCQRTAAKFCELILFRLIFPQTGRRSALLDRVGWRAIEVGMGPCPAIALPREEVQEQPEART